MPGAGIVHFGPFEMHLHACELRKAGRRVKLQEQPLRVLLCLLERRGQLVTREELRRKLWPADTFVDFDTGLNAVIRKLRLVLGEAPGGQEYIETVPRRGYRFISADDWRDAAPARLDSVAVLPFSCSSEAPDMEYLSEGLTEALIRSISEIPGMRKVIARNSVYRYKGQDAQQAGRELDVQAVLIGRVLVNHARVVVSAELLDTQAGTHLWGGQHDQPLDGPPLVAADVAADFSAGLASKFHRRRSGSRAPAHTKNFEAYRLYLRGRYFWNKRPAAGCVDKAIDSFKAATALDPSFAQAYVGLADSYNTLGAWEAGAMAPNVAFELGKAAATRALELNPSLAEAHCSFGYSRLHYDWDWTAAEAEFKRALALNPNYSHVHHWYSHLLTVAGRSEESLEHSLRIIELDPFDLIINVHLAWHYQMAGKFQAALDEARKLIEMESSFHWGYYFSGLALEQMDSARDAVRALERSVELSGSTVMLSALGHAHAMAGDRDRAVTVLRKLEDLSATRYVSSYEVGLIFAALDDRDRAFEWLEKAFAERSGWMPYIAVEPRLKRLREEACFKDFLRRLNLPNS